MTTTTDNKTNITYVDGEIAALEAKRDKLLAEQQQLQAGQVEIEGFEAGQTVKVDLSGLIADPATQQAKLTELLRESPVFEELGGIFRTKEEIKAQMVTAGILPAQAAQLGVTQHLRLTGNRVQKSGGGWVRRVARSTWLLPIGLVIILIASWGWLLYGCGSASGSSTSPKGKTSPNPSPNSTQPSRTPALSLTAPTSPADTNRDREAQAQSQAGFSYIAARPRPASQAHNQAQVQTQIPTQTQTPGTSPNPNPTPTTQKPDSGDNTQGQSQSQSQSQPYDRVGQPPGEIGGNNGPHGAFLAPSRLAVPALELDVPVQKAGVQERIIGPVVSNPLTSTTTPAQIVPDADAGLGSAATPSLSPTPPTPAIAQVEVQVSWPRPGQVTHYGAYPGELGNCVGLRQ